MALWGKSESKEELEVKAKIDSEVQEEAVQILLKMIIEESRNPGTYPTEIGIARIGEGMFLKIGKSVEEARKFINSLILHRVQIINISARADTGLLDEYIVTYWGFKADVVNNIINDITQRKYNEACIKI